MVSLNAVYARISRNKIEPIAGEIFVHRDSVLETIPEVREYKDQQILFGLKNGDRQWTVISVNYIYSKIDGELSVFQIDDDHGKLWDYFSNNDFSDLVKFEDGRVLWLGSSSVCQLILNLTLLLERVPCGTVLD